MSILDFHASLANDDHSELASLSRLSVSQRMFEDDGDLDWTPWT
jgi:hypothetical protein